MPYERLEGEGSYYVEKVKGYILSIRHSRRLIVFIVFVAIFLDNMLLTTVVPILPEYLFDLEHPELKIPVNRSRTITNLVCEPRNESDYSALWNATQAVLEKYSGRYTPLPTRAPDWGEEELLCHNVSREEFSSHVQNISKERRHEELSDVNVRVGILFASKAVVQLITNPFVGTLTNKIGYSIPMFSGFIIIFVSTVIFAIGSSYTVLFIARAIQGIGSSCSSVSGMGMLADRYPDDKERGEAMGFALGGLALGVLLGPPFGGIMFEFVGKETPFLILAVLALGDGILQLYALKPSVKPESTPGTPLLDLIKDPLILVTAGAIMIGNMGIAMMEPSLPIWMIDTMNAPRWQQGIAFLPCSISYLIGTNLFGPMAHKIGRWLTCMIGLVIIGICLFLIPLATNIFHLIAPNFGLGFAIGMVDSSMMPQMGYLVDIRHVSVYGSVYAIADVAFCMGYAIGPAFGGSIVKALSFPWMLYIIAIVSFLYAPLLVILRNPQPREEKETLVINGAAPVKYVSYNQNNKDESIDYDEPNYIQETQIP